MNENSTKNRTDRESVESGAGLNYPAGCDTGDSRQSQDHGDGDCWCPGAGNLAIVKVFRLRTKKSGGRVELGSRDWTLCCQPLGELTKTSTPSTPSIHPSSTCMLLILGTKIYQFPMMFEEVHTPCVLTCIVYYCKNAENARNVSWTFYQRLEMLGS